MTDFNPELPSPIPEQPLGASSLVQEASSLVQSQSSVAPAGLNVPTIDQNLRAISAVESRWRLPAVPDMVRLDLAGMPGVTPDTLASFLQGIDQDLNDVEAQEPPSVSEMLRARYPDGSENRTVFEEARVFFAGMAGAMPPEDPSTDAVIQFKRRAIESGLLEYDGRPLDNRWSPELDGIRRELYFEDLNDLYRGDRPTAVPVTGEGGLVEKIAEWTQPTGLLAAATDLGLWWDTGAISGEFSSWGDKWRKVGESNNPFEFGKNLIDAMLGPIDDIVLPALNLAMFASGVGTVAQIGRLGASAGLRAGRFTSWARGAGRLYAPSPMAALTQPSWTSQKLMGSSGGGRQLLGQGLKAWRELTPVARTKQVAQPLMRAGIMSNAQALVPGYQGGMSLRDMAPGIGEQADELKRIGFDSLWATPVELAFAPYNIFNPGTFFRSGGDGLNLFSKLGKGAAQSVGTVAGRAAIGATTGAAAGALTGDDLDDIARGAISGGVAGAALPAVGRIMSKNDLTSGLFAAGLAGGAGYGGVTLMSDDIDPWTGFGVGLAAAGALSLIPASSPFAMLPNPGKFVGALGRGMSKFSFKPYGDDQRITMAFSNAIRGSLKATDEDSLKRFDQISSEHGVQQAIADHMFTGGVPADQRAAVRVFTEDEMERVYSAEAYYVLAASIEHTADTLAVDRDSKLRAMNKLRNQIRKIDVDRPMEALRDEYARMRALESKSYQKAYDEVIEKIDDDALLTQIRLHNDNADLYLRQLLSPENVPDFADARAAAANADPFAGGPVPERMPDRGWFDPQATPEARQGILEGYLMDSMATFGNWPQFVRQSQMVEDLASSGVLANARFTPGRTPYGDAFNPGVTPDRISDSAKEVDRVLMDALLGDADLAERLGRAGGVSPLARAQLRGRTTVARAETKTKQDFADLRAELKDLERAARKIEFLGGRRKLDDLEKAIGGRDLDSLSSREITKILKAAKITNRDDMKYLVKFAKTRGISISELQLRTSQLIDEKLAEVPWEQFKLNPHVMVDGKALTGREALMRRLRELNREARYTAAAIDTRDLVATTRRTHGDAAADELDAQLKAMEADGYKLVHGVEYQVPNDILNRFEPFADVRAQELNAATFGNFFGRRQPAAARAAQERRERVALSNALREQGVMTVAPDDEKVTWMLQDLRRILSSGQDELSRKIEDMEHMTFWERKRVGLDSALHPYRVEDLVKQKDKTIHRLQADYGWSEDEAKAIYAALRKFRNAEFKDLGLYALEAKFRQQNLAVSSLKFMSGSKYHDSLIKGGGPTWGEATVAAGGAYTGQALMGATAALDANEDQMGGRDFIGLAGGAAAGFVLGRAGTRAGIRAAGGYEKALQRAEQQRWLHVGDHYARYRDTLRFSLSPIFDISRYTEGMMLGQVAAPLRKADGSRMTMPLDMSPAGVKRRMRKQGLDAETTFKQRLREFEAASRGDFDYEVLDSTGKWFQSIGIMGFNPTTWMAGAFTELRTAGMSSKEAYEAARGMYTYGIGGRSAAELSVNFVFFPFSFQKKAFGHLAKWVNDDLGRSIIIHDALKAHEALSERYNLDEFWRDHVPGMRMLQRMNLFAYGLSAGRFGGINAQALETAGRTVASAAIAGIPDTASMALFEPWVGNIRNQQDALEVKRLMTSMVPAINDINWMVRELKETSNVVFSEEHMTSRGQITAGYEEWNEYRNTLADDLERAGWRWSDLYNSPYLEQQRIAYEFKRAELVGKYPRWEESRRESIFNAQMLEMDRREAMVRVMGGGGTDTDVMLAQMQSEIDQVKEALELQGVTLRGRDGWLDAPPWASDYIIGKAVEMAERDNRFLSVWERFFRREFGPITARI